MNLANAKAPPPTSRLALYGMLNGGFVCFTIIAAAIGGDADPRLLYVDLLFMLCSTPVLLMSKLNDRYALYAIFLFIYFISYGALDVTALLSPGPPVADQPFLRPAELLILLGGIVFALGYCATARRQQGNVASFSANDWPMRTLVVVGILLWSAGTFANWYWNFRLLVTPLEIRQDVSQTATSLLMLGRYAQPMGIVVLAYAFTLSRNTYMWLLIVAIVAFQVVFGFITNTKGGAMLGGILVIMTAYLVKGRIPKAWLLGALIFIVVAFPIFQAYRAVVVGERGISNTEAAQNIGKVLRLAIQGQRETPLEHRQSFLERSSVKASVDMIVNRTGVDVPYQHGYTLIPLATSLIPRLIWPEKLDVQTGLLVNQEFHLAQAVVYISPSHLGELYWNFGWAGAIAGMLLLGLLLGWINTACDMSAGVSVTRLLILAVTIYQAGVRFEGSIASEYAVWLRSILGILLLHWLFARRGLRHMADDSSDADFKSGEVVGTPVRPFPNLLA